MLADAGHRTGRVTGRGGHDSMVGGRMVEGRQREQAIVTVVYEKEGQMLKDGLAEGRGIGCCLMRASEAGEVAGDRK